MTNLSDLVDQLDVDDVQARARADFLARLARGFAPDGPPSGSRAGAQPAGRLDALSAALSTLVQASVSIATAALRARAWRLAIYAISSARQPQFCTAISEQICLSPGTNCPGAVRPTAKPHL
jgi:hypothetical protein